jgi:hypothetical protein
MPRTLALIALLCGLLFSVPLQAQVRQEIAFPDLPGYSTLKCDFHMHSVFSDGSVWPTVRVDEAWRLGLDAISLTDHIEYQPHEDDIRADLNRPFDLAAARAEQHDLLFPRGAEITRDTPPGHFNAIFLDDIRPLDTADFVEVIKRANAQNAFVFWNHQEWKGPERGRWMEVHTQIYENEWLHGMEVCNGATYYPTAHRWCLEKGLTMLGNSDIHGPDLVNRTVSEEHRTLTLVFARQRSLEALQEALFAGRTAVWFENQVIGRREWLEPMFARCVTVDQPHLRTVRAVWTKLRNHCDLEIRLQRTGELGPAEIILPARSVTLLKVGTGSPEAAQKLSYLATNFVIEPETGLPVTLEIQAAETP